MILITAYTDWLLSRPVPWQFYQASLCAAIERDTMKA